MLPAELLLGADLGLSVMPLFATATRKADPGDAGATGAAANTAQRVGASIGTAVSNTIAAGATASFLATHGAGAIVAANAHGYSIGSGGVAAVFVLAAIVAGMFMTSRPATQSNGEFLSTELSPNSAAMDLTYEPEA